jgi:uncharacterized SAM-binding protein YcdF (DUF218 family)
MVLGYSPRRPEGLHPICAARVRHAASVAGPDDVVVLSGTADEVERMEAAWEPLGGRTLELDGATRTAESAVAARRLAAVSGADEVLLVTSWWHRPRAELMLRTALRGTGVRVSGSGAPSPWSPLHLAREAACVVLVPLHLALARRAVARRALDAAG